jgi:nucleotide-binding universal stress UspA family protein
MSNPIMRFGILVGIDGSPESDAAIRWATDEAAMRDETLTLMHVVAPIIATWPIIPISIGMTEWQEEHARLVLERGQNIAKETAGESRLLQIRTELRYTDIATALVDASREARMTVVGGRGLSALGRIVLGSVSSNLLRHVHGPVAVVHADGRSASEKGWPIVLGIDGSPASEDATALAFDEASRRGVDLVALHAWADSPSATLLGIDWGQYEEEGHEVLAERLAGWQEKYTDVHVRRRLVVDQPARRILDETREAQLVIVGSHGRGGFAGMLLGSVSSTVAQSAEVPTIVVRGGESR